MRGDVYEAPKLDNPWAKANCLSRYLFCYASKLLSKGWHKEIDESDLTEPLDVHKSSVLGEKIAVAWSKEVERARKQKKEPSMARVIFKVFYSDFIAYGIVMFIMEVVVRLSQPLFVGLYVRYFSEANKQNTEPMHSPIWLERLWHYWSPGQSPIQKNEAWVYAFGVFFTNLVAVLTFHPYIMYFLHVGMRIRIACCSLIYRKALRIRMTSLDGTTVGSAVNLMSNDVNRFDAATNFIHYIWLAPVQACLAVYFIYLEVGKSALAGLFVLLVVIPLQVILGIFDAIYRRASAKRTDERIRQMNEIIQSIQVIKMYAWENAFAQLIHDKRKKEMKCIIKTSFIKGLIMSFIMFTARLGIFLTIMSYVLLGNDVTSENAFIIASYYVIIRQTMTVYFPQGIIMVTEMSVAISRIQKFMLIEEATIGDPSILDPYFVVKGKQMPNQSFNVSLFEGEEPVVHIFHGMAKYGSDVCLDGIDLLLRPGELTAIVGLVGSGKTCILSLILGELQLYSGSLNVKGIISYASQEPWLFAGSVRQNILFGRPLKISLYRQVVKVCALQRDFELLPYGDRTVIGERGISLSGGQRARVNLARAVYKEADIYLLDDPLSAVDINVGAQLFDECITKFLQNKIVILVTHQLQYLKNATRIIVMSEGSMALSGSYNSIVSSKLDFATLIEEAIGMHAVSLKPAQEPDPKEMVIKELSKKSVLFSSIIDIEGFKKLPDVEPEMRTKGAVDFTNYKKYFSAGGNCCLLLILCLFFLGAQLLGSAGDFFLERWVSLEENRSHGKSTESLGMFSQLSRKDCIYIFTIIIALTVVVAISRSLYFFTICARSSVKLHDRMFYSIIHASMKFYNNNTSGRILNRFSKDLGAVDETLPYAFIDTTQLMLNLVGAIIVIGFVNPWLLIPITVIILFFYMWRKFYLKTSRSVKRLEGITRSPVFAHLNATLQGLPTIRCNNAEEALVVEFDSLQDTHSSAWFMFLYASRLFGLWVDIVCTVFIGMVTFSFLIFETNTTAGSVGLAITQCIGLTGLVQWGLRQSAELENQMTSVERVLEFTKVEQEPALDSTPEKKPPASWPKNGRIEFMKVFMWYSTNEPPVLKNLNLTVEPEEKIGIVGRTGAGKSSLISTLFRLTYYQGTIMVDNLDISIIGLHDLRRKISIIPQEPILFSGTMRYNLDPFGEYDDEAIVNALIDVEIKNAILHGKDYLVTEGGTNISVGERQMVCMARAILRNNKILVLDEATANVDAMTDKLIQTTIRTKFSRCTVLTIAHRLHTIMDSDKVIVMSAGVPVEFDHPHVLLQNSKTIFYDMVEKTGTAMAKSLKQIAKESYESRRIKTFSRAK